MKKRFRDPDDAPELDRDFFENARVEVGGVEIKRGRPVSGAGGRKEQVTLRLSPLVLEFFRSGGDGWQSRIDNALIGHISRATPKAGRHFVVRKVLKPAGGSVVVERASKSVVRDSATGAFKVEKVRRPTIAKRSAAKHSD